MIMKRLLTPRLKKFKCLKATGDTWLYRRYRRYLRQMHIHSFANRKIFSSPNRKIPRLLSQSILRFQELIAIKPFFHLSVIGGSQYIFTISSRRPQQQNRLSACVSRKFQNFFDARFRFHDLFYYERDTFFVMFNVRLLFILIQHVFLKTI